MANDKSLEQIEAENAAKQIGLDLEKETRIEAEKKLKTLQQVASAQAQNDADQKARLKERSALQKESIVDRETELGIEHEKLKALKKETMFTRDFLKRMEKQEQIADKQVEQGEDLLKLAQDRLAAAKRGAVFMDGDRQKTLADLEKEVKHNQRALKVNKKKLSDGNEAVAQGKALLKNIGEQAMGQSKLGKGIYAGVKGIAGMVKMANGLTVAFRAGAVSASMLTAALGIGIILLVVGAMAKLVEWTIGLAIKTRDATVAFQRATGAAEKFGKAIPNLERDMRAVGVSMEEATAAQNALYTSTTDYTMASAGARKDLLKTTALMGEFGVSVETSAKIAQAATKGLGIGIGGADELLLGLAAHAQDIGVPISKLSEDFVANRNELKRWGNDGVRVFNRLAMVSKVTGMEISRLLSITEKFDTFEGAAKQAGMLNAAIGGNMVNALDLMMTTDPVERFSMIRDSIMDTVGSFDEMDYYQKKFYANAAGLKDVGELAAMMSSDFDVLDGSIGQNSKSYADQREQAKKWQSTMEILKNTVAAFAPVIEQLQEPLQNMLDEFAKGEGPLKEFGDSIGRVMSEAIVPFLNEIGEENGPLQRFWGWLEGLPAVIDKVVLAAKVLGSIFAALGIAIAIATAPAWLIWAAVAAIGAAIVSLWAIFKQKNSPSFLDLFTGGVLEKGFRLASKAIELFFAPIVTLGKMLKSLGHMLAETFNFAGIKTNVTDFVKWIPGTWAESVTGIKTEMEISSPSEKMMREVIDPTFVQPMQSVAAKMPGLVDDVYGDVPERAAANLAPLTATPQKPAAGMEGVERVLQNAFDQTLLGRMSAAFEGKAAAAPAAAGGGPQTIQVSIPISIGKDPLGTVVTEIVDGRLGTVSYQGMAGQ